MSKDTGGPAFPVPLNPGESYQAHHIADGMTLRDYFAAKAMQAAICSGVQALGFHDSYKSPEGVAMIAHKYADAMLAERAK